MRLSESTHLRSHTIRRYPCVFLALSALPGVVVMSRALPPDWIHVGIAKHGSGSTQIILLIGGLYFFYWHDDSHGAEVVVLVDGQRFARLNLFNDQDLEVPGHLGHSHIQVREGQVRFVDSACPNKQCVHTGWLKQSGEVAVCLPNKVSVQVLADDPRFDAVNF